MDARGELWYNVGSTQHKGGSMDRLARISGLVVLLLGVGLSASGSAGPGPEPAAATLEVGTSPLCAYHTIQDAIAAANPGDTIKVENTLFVENSLLISRNLTLAGGYNTAHPYACLTQTGFNYTTVEHAGTASSAILRIQNAQVTIQWFIFEDNAYGGGLEVDGATLDLKHSLVRNNDAMGLLIYNSSDVTLTDVEVAGNSANVGGGLNIDGGSQVVADDSVIRDNNGWTHGAGVNLQLGSTFTARNGTSIRHNRTAFGCYEGGGIYATGQGTEVYLDASHVISNTALAKGGGLYLAAGAQATIRNGSWIQQNVAYLSSPPGGGGGACVEGSGTALKVYDSVFYNNGADPDGGGIWNDFGTLELSGAFLLANNARDKGGGLYTSFGATTIEGSYFIGNVATFDSGGAIATYRSELTAHRSLFTANSSDLEGSAVFVQGANGTFEPAAEIVNCYLVDNPTTATGIQGPPAGGSTLYVEGTQAKIIHNTLAHGSQQASFGVYVGEGSDLVLIDNIIHGFYIGIRRVSAGTGTALSIHDLFYNNAFDYDAFGITVVNPVPGDPAFAGAGNYHLSTGSAAIDAGVDAGVYVDYDGDYRPWAAGFDIGADEYPARVRVFVPFTCRRP
jgi:hypothetical protein